MSVFGKLIKDAMVGTVVGTYNVIKEANEKISGSVKGAQLKQAKEDVEGYDKSMTQYSDEEQAEIKAMSKKFAMEDIAKKQAKGRNRLAFLEATTKKEKLEYNN